MTQGGSRRVSVVGSPVDALTFSETLTEVARLITARRPVQHCVVNASKIVLMHRDSRLKDIVSSCELINADGQSIVWASRLLGQPVPARVAGIDLFQALLSLSERCGYSVFLLGATQEVLEGVLSRLHREHPGLKVAGSHNGYWRDEQTRDVVEVVRAAAPDILFVGMPSPRKEYWLAENLDALGVPFSMGVGGSFDVYAGAVKRAPLWLQRVGLEWFYRFVQEPGRMWRRYLVGNLEFACLVLRAWRAQRQGVGSRTA
jgi:N-acetylglucosaminyldiphosphoundecaprenol N-acetyl-beta-D-mannosaminyltransferase